jgi:prepilin-type N-terminal cleavage/methylation domain-containing protein
MLEIKKTKGGTRGGFTLVEVLVGVALMSIVFLGIFGAYRLGLKAIGLSKNKTTATAIANSRIEMIRNLDYELVGLVGGALPSASGTVESVATETINNGVYTIETKIRYAADAADGSMAPADSCVLDYKKIDVAVSWGGSFPGNVTVSTDVAPKNLVQEVQSCLNQPGGVLEVTVFDSAGILVPSPSINVYDTATNGIVAQATPVTGKHSFPLVVGSYRAEVFKNGYSSARTYSTAEIAVPDSPNPAVLNGELTPMSLSIDLAATLSIDGVTPTGQDSFADSFADGSLISQSSNIDIVSGNAVLSGPPYSGSGEVVSNSAAPADLVAWDNFVFDDEHQAGTDAVYQILYFDGAGWVLIPDTDLAQNSAGFTVSPVNLVALDKNVYPQLRVKGMLSTTDAGLTPSLHSWEIKWTNSTGSPVANSGFHVQGAKTIGTDGSGNAVYKYSQDNVFDGAGHAEISGIDGDAYTFTVDPSSGLSLLSTDHDPQPVNADSGSTVAMKLFLRAQSALRLTVRNEATLAPIFSAEVRLAAPSLIYDRTQSTDTKGQTYFAPLQNGDYSLDITVPGYDAYSGTVTVSGESSADINIRQQD